MKHLLLTAALLISQISSAATPAVAAAKKYNLKIDWSMNGKHVASPEMILTQGDPTTIMENTESGKMFLSVSTIAPDQVKDAKIKMGKTTVAMEFVVGKIEADGKETILSRPRIIANEGQAATLTSSDTNTKKEILSLTVTATAAK